MFDEINQFDQETTQEVVEESNNQNDEFTFDDTSEQNLESEQEIQPEIESNDSNKPFLNIKFNKEDKGLSEEEARTYAQKGMYFDSIKNEYEDFKNSATKTNTVLEKYAKRSGVSAEEYLSYLEEQDKKLEVEEMAKRYGISDSKIAEELFDMRQRVDSFEQEKKRQEEELRTKETNQKQFSELVNYFQQEYGRMIEPEKDLPEEVLKIADSENVSIVTAFRLYELSQLKSNSKIQSKNIENSHSSTGSVTENAPDYEEGYSQETIENMSIDDMAKHMDNPKFKKAMASILKK